MAQTVAFSKLSTILQHFNNAISNDKLDEKALETIQRYLNDSEGTTLNKVDEQKLRRSLRQLDLLGNRVSLARVSFTIMEQINRQLRNLSKLITEDPEESKKNPLFIIIKLEACFLKILSVEALDRGEQRKKRYEDRIASSESFKSSPAITLRQRALYMDRQQRVINELMNAALFDVIQYFENENESFDEYFTDEFLNSLRERAENLNFSQKDKIGDDVYNILSETATTCCLPMTILISNLVYAMIGYGERMNEYTIPLQTYIRNTNSPSLRDFNQTVYPDSALSFEDVQKFERLFHLYVNILMSDQQDIPANMLLEASLEDSDKKPALSKESRVIPEPNIKSEPASIHFSEQLGSCSVPDSLLLEERVFISSELKPIHPADFASSASAGKQTQPASPRPAIEDGSDLKFIWLEPNLEDFYDVFHHTIYPATVSPYNIKKLKSRIPDVWIDKCIFLCLSAKHVRNLLLNIHEEPELYRVYVLCQNKAEEDAFRTEGNDFNKIRIVTNSREIFIRQLALDVVQPFIDVGDGFFNERDYLGAMRWYESTREKIITYDKSGNEFLRQIIDEKIARCCRT